MPCICWATHQGMKETEAVIKSHAEAIVKAIKDLDRNDGDPHYDMIKMTKTILDHLYTEKCPEKKSPTLQ